MIELAKRYGNRCSVHVVSGKVRVPRARRIRMPLGLMCKTRGREEGYVIVGSWYTPCQWSPLLLPSRRSSHLLRLWLSSSHHWHYATSQCPHGGREVLGRTFVEIHSYSCLSGAVEVRIGRGMQWTALLPLWWTQIAGVGRQA